MLTKYDLFEICPDFTFKLHAKTKSSLTSSQNDVCETQLIMALTSDNNYVLTPAPVRWVKTTGQQESATADAKDCTKYEQNQMTCQLKEIISTV